VFKGKLPGANHTDVALTLNNLAVLCKQEGRYAEAAALYQRAPTVCAQALDEKHHKLVECRANYAALLEASCSRVEGQAIAARRGAASVSSSDHVEFSSRIGIALTDQLFRTRGPESRTFPRPRRSPAPSAPSTATLLGLAS
jgi:hypothetical protein